jgi:HK97 family phage portal protein
MGQSPICAAYPDIGVGNAIAAQQAAFYRNEARPSAVLSTEMQLDKDQVQALRDRWNDQTRNLHQGGTPILTSGLKVQPWSFGGKDAGTADILKLSNENIALAFRIPLQVLGLSGGTSYGSTEALMQFWLASGLGFCLNHVEEAFGLLFGLYGQPDEYLEFDTAALLRTQFKDRIEALVRAVQGGVFSPNEARNTEGLDNVKSGDEPRVQQQVVPLSAAEAIPSAPPSPGAKPAPSAAPASTEKPKPEPAPETKGNRDDIKREVRNLLTSAARIKQRRLSA